MMKDYIIIHEKAKGIRRVDKQVAKYYSQLLQKKKINLQDLLHEENIREQKNIDYYNREWQPKKIF